MGGKASAASKNKWNAAHYDRIIVQVQKGQKELFQAIAKAQNKSLNAYIVEAIREKMERETRSEK